MSEFGPTPIPQPGLAPAPAKADLRMVQIVAAQWGGQNNKLTYSLFGLSDEGRVYRLSSNRGWTPMPMNLVDPSPPQSQSQSQSRPGRQESYYGTNDDEPF